MLNRLFLTVLLLTPASCSVDKCERDCDQAPPPSAPAPVPDPGPQPEPEPPAGGLPLPIPLPPGTPLPPPALPPLPEPIPGEPGPGPGPAPSDPGDIEAQERELGRLINEERLKAGLSPVEASPELSCAAGRHAADIGPRRGCSHAGSDGSSFSQRAAACGLQMKSGGEIIACGQQTPRAAVDAWLGSPGHRAVMLGRSQRLFGVGLVDNFWVVVFAGE